MMWRNKILVKSYTKKGKFIVLEGIEGSGKSTLLSGLEKHYRPLKKIHITREPGGTKLGDTIRSLVLKKQEYTVHPLAELLLIEAARTQHCQEVILPALQTHDLVICDRFTLSSLAYQGKARGLGFPLVSQLNEIATQGCIPDLVLFIDLPSSVALARRKQRNQHDPHCVDKMELETSAFHEAVFRGYQEACTYEKNVIKIKGDISPETLLKEALQHINRLL